GSPIGKLLVAASEQGVCALSFNDHPEALEPRLRRLFGHFFRIEDGDPMNAVAALRRYFAGELDALYGMPLVTLPTPMQRRVWGMVRSLAPGRLTTYATLAERLGMPRAQRAVGVCLASNPVPL